MGGFTGGGIRALAVTRQPYLVRFTKEGRAIALDERDITLSLLLQTNSRLSYQELATKLGISVNAVHKRIRDLIDAGIIRVFSARPSLMAINAMIVWVFGHSGAPSTSNLQERLHSNDSTYWVALASGNFVYVGAYVQDLPKLEEYVSFVSREARMSDPVVGMIGGATPGMAPVVPLQGSTKGLHPLDYQIIYSLHKNSRKPLSDVAEELRVSAKTVRRRLTRMIEDGLVELSTEWYPDVSNDIITMFHLQLAPSADKGKVYGLLEKYRPNFLINVGFSNLPNLIISFVWTNTMKELKELQKRIQDERVFESVTPNVLYTGYMFDTWRDKILAERGAPRRLEHGC
jgi:DNA-binding Lrp family transcriptional regulator